MWQSSKSRWRRCMQRASPMGIGSLPGAGVISRRCTVAFNVQGIRLAVHHVTAEIRILYSVHAADIGRLINPMQCQARSTATIDGPRLGAHREHGDDVDGTLVNQDLRKLPHSLLCRHAGQRGDFR